MLSRRLALAVVLGVGVLAAPGRAAAADAGTGDEAEDLARSIATQAETLSTDDCASACKALASMRRAADRLCSLDPGKRCADARARLDDASRKVRAACPTCEVAMPAPPEDKPSVVHTPAKGGGGAGGAPATDAVPQAAPPAESRRGGCASCSETNGAPDAGVIAAAVAATIVLARRSKRRR